MSPLLTVAITRLSAAAAPTVKTEIAVAAVSMFLKDIRLPPKIKL